jgi:porphyrinogen peroxidase
MHTSQAGLFALGTSSHTYLEFDLLDAKKCKEFASELENKASDSHVARTDQDEYGNIFRRNMPYGSVDDHGTMFVGLSADQKRLSRMLDSMAGLVTGTRDALTRFTQPLTGSYYFVPSVESLRRLRGNPSPV